MAEIFTPLNTSNLNNQTSITQAIDSNFNTIATLLNDVMSRSGVGPNAMSNTVDMNSNQIINLPAPTTLNSAARLQDLSQYSIGSTTAANLVTGNNTFTGTNTFANALTAGSTLSVAGNGTFNGNNTYTGNNYFKSGYPWFDVIAYGADKTGVSDSYTAIQNAINAAVAFYSGGFGGAVVFFPPGVYLCNTGLTVSRGVKLVGSGRGNTSVYTTNDINLITFDSTCVDSGAEKISFLGYQHSSATGGAVIVGLSIGTNLTFYDCNMWFGSAGLVISGLDHNFIDCHIMGYTYGVASSGSNWYIRCKFDALGVGETPQYGFNQGNPSTADLMENHFTECDFSNAFTLGSVNINDGGANVSITLFHACVFSHPIQMVTGRWLLVNGCEVGGSITNYSTGYLTVANCWGSLPGIVVSGNNLNKSNNANMT